MEILNGENANHIFFFWHCDVASHFWQKFYREAGVAWDSPTQISGLFLQNHSGFGNGKKAKVLWGCGVLAVFFGSWVERIEEFFKSMVG